MLGSQHRRRGLFSVRKSSTRPCILERIRHPHGRKAFGDVISKLQEANGHSACSSGTPHRQGRSRGQSCENKRHSSAESQRIVAKCKRLLTDTVVNCAFSISFLERVSGGKLPTSFHRSSSHEGQSAPLDCLVLLTGDGFLLKHVDHDQGDVVLLGRGCRLPVPQFGQQSVR